MSHSIVKSWTGTKHLVIPLHSELQNAEDKILCFCKYEVKNDDKVWDVKDIPNDICKTCMLRRRNFGLA